MPHVIVTLWPGTSERQKRRLAEAITKDIVEKAATLYKKPGYDM